MSVLTKVDQYGLFEVRMESIGGLGANLAGKMLSEIGQDYLGVNVASFSSYGSEKKGSPVKAFVRFAEPTTEIRINNPIETPTILVIFTDSLLNSPDVLAGCSKDTIVIVNTRLSSEQVMKKIKFPSCKLGVINATDIAMEEGVKTNGVLLGALAKASSFIKKEHVEGVFKKIIGKKYPALLEANLKAIDRGYDSLNIVEMQGDPKAIFPPFVRSGGMGYANQLIGGVIPNPGNTANKSNAAGRSGLIPFFELDKCINCGMCNIVCSDQCIVWEKGPDKKTGKMTMNMAGIDYQYCKGCLKCVEICPVKALTEQKERDHDVSTLTKDVLDKKAFVQNHK
jgi:pyruvate ferredoxin oxidoreductase gamma subunit